MHKYRNQIIAGLVITLGIYIVLLLLLDSGGQLSQTDGVLEQIQSLPLTVFVLCIIFQIFVVFFRFAEWHYYLGVINARDKISLKDSLIIFVAGFTMVVSPGKAAELLKAVFLKVKTGVPVAVSAPVVIAERVVDGLAVIVMMFFTLLLAGDRLSLGEYGDLSRVIVFSSAFVLAVGLIVVQIQPLAYFFLNQIIANLPLVRRLHKPLNAFYESSREVFKLRHVIPTTLLGVFVYLSSTAGFVTILAGFGLDVTWTLCLQVAFIVGVASAVGALSFVPNGAGVTEISNFGMLMAVIAPENPELTPAVAVATALLQGFFHKWFRVLVGFVVTLIFRKNLFPENFEEALMEIKSTQAQDEILRVE